MPYQVETPKPDAAAIAGGETAPTLPTGARPDSRPRAEAGALGDVAKDVGKGVAIVERQMALPWRHDGGALPLGLGLMAAMLVAGPARTWVLRRMSAMMLRRSGATAAAIHGGAVAAIVVTTVAFTAAALVAFGTVASTITLLPEVVGLGLLSFIGIVLTGFGVGVGRALDSPDAPALRPLHVPAGSGKSPGLYAALGGAMLGSAALIDQCSRLMAATPTTIGLVHGVVTVLEAVLIARFLVLAARMRERLAESPDRHDVAVPAVFGATAFAWAGLALAAGALVAGRAQFAMLTVQSMLWAGLVLSTAWILTRFVDASVNGHLDVDRRTGRFALKVMGVREDRLRQAALLVSATVNVAIWVIAVFLVLAPLQGDGANVAERLRPSPMLEAFRSMRLSPRTLATAMAILVGGVLATRLARGWLDDRFLPSTGLDAGARNSLVTGMGYLGVIAALLAASSTLGLQLEKITLIASALTVGIGFGLQAIIQNFVSGVIMLFERPINLGDWVSVSGSEGRVRRMRVRATEVVGDDGTVAIVPNSAFISTTVLNRSNAMDRSSFDLTIKISDASSAETARELLAQRIAECDAVRHHPAPRFYLEAMGDRSWTFRVRMEPADDASQARTTSDALFHLSTLSEAGVRIAVG